MGYDSTSGILSNPMNIQDIANALGVPGTTVMGDAVVNGTVNKHSMRKPIVYNKIAPLTDAEWASANYGWTINDYADLDQAVTAWANDTAWTYTKPTDGDHFRWMDLHGYNAAAVSIFLPQYNATAYRDTGGNYFCQGISTILPWGKFVGHAPYYSDLYIGLVIQRQSNSWVYMLNNSTSEDPTLELLASENFHFSVSELTAGQSYTIFPVLTTYNADSSRELGKWVVPEKNKDGTWWPIPVAAATISVQNRVQPYDNMNGELLDLTWADEEKMPPEEDKYGFYRYFIDSIEYRLTNTGNATWQGQARLKLYLCPASGYETTTVLLPLHTNLSVSGSDHVDITDDWSQDPTVSAYKNSLSTINVVLYNDMGVQVTEIELQQIVPPEPE